MPKKKKNNIPLGNIHINPPDALRALLNLDTTKGNNPDIVIVSC